MRKLLSVFSIPLLAVGFLVAKPQEAKAWFKVCNQTGQDTHVAFSYPESGTWYTQGWYVIRAGTCQQVYDPELRTQYYYVHAQNYSGQTWGSDLQLCNYWVNYRRNFKMAQTSDRVANCQPPNKSLMPFAKVDTGSRARNFTYNLTD